jgi:hypothetical protein
VIESHIPWSHKMHISVFHLNTLIYFNTEKTARDRKERNWVCHYYAYQIKSPLQIIFLRCRGTVKRENYEGLAAICISFVEHCRTFFPCVNINWKCLRNVILIRDHLTRRTRCKWDCCFLSQNISEIVCEKRFEIFSTHTLFLE